MTVSSTSGPDLPLDPAPQGDGPLAANLVGGAERESATGRTAGGGYSRFVAWMKVLLPVVALLLIGLVVIWPRLKGDDTFRISFSSAHMSGESEPGMDNARYVGTDENRQPYSVTADLARLVPNAENEFALELPKADLTLEDGSWLVLTADTGLYVHKERTLVLNGNVNLFHDTGYEIATEHLDVDLKTNRAVGNKELVAHGPFGELEAQGLELVDKGKVIFFKGPAKLTLYSASSSAGGKGQ